MRWDLVHFNNADDLDSKLKDDKSAYVGMDYSLTLHREPVESDIIWLVKLERNGPWDNNAPVWTHSTLQTGGSRIEDYREDEFLPQFEEFWLDTSLLDALRMRVGLFTYEVGFGFSLNGSYENYGLLLYRDTGASVVRFYYCRPDLVFKNPLGPRIRQEEDEGQSYEHNAANFFALDALFDRDTVVVHPYIGALVDYTSPDKRSNFFAAPIERDIMGTVGASLTISQGAFQYRAEFARNFGTAKSADPAYEDIIHAGYLIFGEVSATYGDWHPLAQVLIGSGNKAPLEAAVDGDESIRGSRNRAFGYSSPMNDNLSDTISGTNVDVRPLVASGCGYGLQYGVSRPSTFAASDFDNLITLSTGFDVDLTDRLNVGVYGFYLQSFEKGVGMLNGEPRELSRELGSEVDLYVDYRLNEHVLISLLSGYFFPGQYYRQMRDDTDGNFLSPFIRGDGEVDGAYQVEIAVEVTF